MPFKRPFAFILLPSLLISGIFIVAPRMASADPITRTQPLGFTSCTASEQADLVTAVNGALAYATSAATYFADNRAGARYVYWFGAYSSTRWANTKLRVDRVLALLTSGTLNIDCSLAGCGVGVYAYVYATDIINHTFHSCSAFWAAPVTGTDSRAGTFIHELEHFNDIGSTFDYVYGQSASHSLALSTPTDAAINSDSYEYFFENTPAIADNAAAMVVSQSALTFSSTEIGATSSPQVITLTNSGVVNLIIDSITTSGNFSTSGTCSGATVAPQTTCTLSVTFAPTATGQRIGTISLASNAVVTLAAFNLTGTAVVAAPTTSTTTLVANSAPETTTTTVPSSTTTVPAPTTTTTTTVAIPIATKVKLSAINNADWLRVVVTTGAGTGQRIFVVQKKLKNNKWASQPKKYVLKSSGRADINLAIGTYRIVISASQGFAAATSSAITLRR